MPAVFVGFGDWGNQKLSKNILGRELLNCHDWDLQVKRSIIEIYSRNVFVVSLPHLFLLDGLGRLRKSLYFQPLCRLQEGGELILSYVDLASVHEL